MEGRILHNLSSRELLMMKIKLEAIKKAEKKLLDMLQKAGTSVRSSPPLPGEREGIPRRETNDPEPS